MHGYTHMFIMYLDLVQAAVAKSPLVIFDSDDEDHQKPPDALEHELMEVLEAIEALEFPGQSRRKQA